jgi:DNA (cytosine-5)-methyltransferase 1
VRSPTDPVAVDLFAGAGGLSEGLGQGGFKVSVANEINKHAAATYRYNHPNTAMVEKDIRELKAVEITDIAGDEIFLVAGGPPCQGVSFAGRRRADDPRNLLFAEFVRMVGNLEPNFFIMENVVGLLSFGNGTILQKIETSFADMGYFVSKRILNSADFGVPQIRKRVFIFGSKKRKHDINSMPVNKGDPLNVEDAIGDLDFLKAGEFTTKYLKPAQTDYQTEMRKNSIILYNHEAPTHKTKTLNRFSAMKQGQCAKDLPRGLKTRKLVMFRLISSEPSRTIATLPDDYVHYRQNRTITVREMARLQSFRDSYAFLGPRSTGGSKRRTDCPQCSQVGNSVPPFVARAIAEWVRNL